MKQMRIACIGDSIVNGYPYIRDCAWPERLSILTGHACFNFGENGQTSPQIRRRFLREVRSCSPDLVILSAGTNDFLFTDASPTQVSEQIAAMTGDAKNAGILPALYTPILTIPRAAERMWQEGTDYEEVNRKLRDLRLLLLELSHQEGIPCCDTQALYEDLTNDLCPSDPYATMLYVDGIHPTQDGYIKLAHFLLPLTEEVSCSRLTDR